MASRANKRSTTSITYRQSASRRLDVASPSLVLWATNIAFAAALFVSSRISEVLPAGDAVRGLAIGLVIVGALYGVVACILERERVAAGVSLALLLSVWLYVYDFASRTHGSFSFAAGGLYFPIALVGLFVAVARAGRLDAALKFAAIAATGYALAYLGMSQLLKMGVFHWTKGSQLIIDTDMTSGRDARVLLASTYVIFGLLVATARFRAKASILQAAIIVVMLAALWLSHSRTITLLAVLIWLGYVLTKKANAISAVAFGIFVLGAVASMAIAFSPGFDPFAAFAHDQSGAARSTSIAIVQGMAPDLWWVGGGIATGPDGYYPMTKSYVFQPGDVGMLGMLFMYGIWGVIFYVTTTYAACRSWRFMPRLGLSPSIAEGLGLTGAVVTVFSLLAPTFAGGSGSAFGALFISFLCLQGDIALESLTRKRRAWEFAPRR